MNRQRRSVLIAMAAIAGSGWMGAPAAQTYPAKPVRLIVPFAPGGSSDILARIVAQKLQERWGQPVVVENKPGAATTLAADYVAKQPADGYTLMLAPAPFVIAAYMYPRLAYDTVRDFTAVSLLTQSALVVAVNPAVPAKSLPELIALAKAEPGRINYGSPGNGSLPHLATELFAQRAGIRLTHVPYKGGGPAVNDLVAGNIQMMMPSPLEVLQFVKAGRLRLLATAAPARMASLPDLPTIQEVGIGQFDVGAWFGVVARSGTPPEIVERLGAEIGAVMKLADVRGKLEGQGMDVVGSTPAGFAEFMKAEHAKWSEAVKVSGAKVE